MYAKGRGLLLECHQIFWTPMEIASRGKLYPVTNRALQIGRRLLHRRKIKTVFVAGMRRGNDVRNPISNRHFRHGQRFLKGFRSVVHPVQNVAVQINHIFADPSSAHCAHDLRYSQQEHQRRKNPPHLGWRNSFCQAAARDTSQENPWNQQQSRLPGNVSRVRVRDHRQQSSRWYQRHQTRSLRPVLAESQQQPQNGHQYHATANSKHSRCNSRGHSGPQDSAVDKHLPIQAPPSLAPSAAAAGLAFFPSSTAEKIKNPPNNPFNICPDMGTANLLPRYAPRIIPSAHKIPARKSTFPAFQYCRSAPSPIGGSNMNNEVPCARCWSIRRTYIIAGTSTMPPPMPSSPTRMPATIPTVNTRTIVTPPALNSHSTNSGRS